jgi:hypothetical protein
MSKPISYLKDYHTNQKEFLFRKVLEGQLAINNYAVTRPEPDIGHDMLLSDRQQTFVYTAQLKSSFTVVPLKQGRVRRYLTNVKANKLEASFGRKYFYFFGLYEPDYEPIQFRIGCIPSSFFEDYWEFLIQKKLQKDGRVLLEIDYYIDEERYFMFMQPLVEVTGYFENFDAIS